MFYLMGFKNNMENTCESKSSCTHMMLNKIKEILPELIGIIIGATGGFIYYKTVGCSTGSCPITSNPWLSTVWGSLMGYFLGRMFKQKNKKTNK